jgi:hypothetical protein
MKGTHASKCGTLFQALDKPLGDTRLQRRTWNQSAIAREQVGPLMVSSMEDAQKLP